MNPHYLAFIQLGKELAETHGVVWGIPLDQSGTAIKGHDWDLTALAGGVAPKHRLRHFSSERSALDAINATRTSNGLPIVPGRTLSPAWQDLIKAAVIEQLFVRRNSFGHVANNVARPLRVIATCAADTEPWAVTADEMVLAVRTGNSIQASGKLGDLIAGLTKVLFDTNHLTDAGPLYPALAASRLQPRATRRSKFLNSHAEIRHNLEDRKRAERLPERRAFWELVRIVMTEQPMTFMDELRFAAIRIMILTGFRIGEATLLPAEWRTDRHYFDSEQRSAGELGGYSQSLMIRHFAEKQQAKNADSKVLIDRTHYVPQMFEEIVSETLTRAAAITGPLRNTLRKQTETGRVLPDFALSELVPVTQIYTHLTGNALWLDMSEEQKHSWIQKCRQNYSAESFDELQKMQEQRAIHSPGEISAAARMYFRRMVEFDGKDGGALVLRRADGNAISFDGKRDMSQVFVRVGDLENYLRYAAASKLPDTEIFSLADRSFASWKFLFLHPKRSLAEERNNGVCDISRYVSVSRMKNITSGNGDTTLHSWLSDHIGDNQASNGSVTVIDLSLVPAEVVHIITAVIARMTLEALQRYRKLNSGKTLPTVLVMEEAHTFIRRYADDAENHNSAAICCQVFEKIAREGRKFGLGLVLSSQRPSELSPTVLSQCNSYLLHRISNDRDQELVHKLVPDNLRGLLRDLPSLPSRYAILLGWASELPVLVQMNNLPADQQPRSNDPDFWAVWSGEGLKTGENGQPVERTVDWQAIAADWQQTTSEQPQPPAPAPAEGAEDDEDTIPF